ncbi:ATPase BadF/BadG/BcrA/BcrD type [Beutenbergia cavernae DSM 12333]|uniref:ATPase BadF/BadG/BcrA/BcrD type n=1 Tax=Beutenbergia cavernae (strain ATCC BAA-8 / DSM 12333 / CCUG 43141 / JCM 11478 / NBRC 16432 / NCIMB 13614 / HKI 0122) TaxID=471853 RepID=C5BWH5_BEUC1|nr:BadF/BadG/BcrA/BcrD ATPase family protein [Beutenbergia cavernae]ACQ78633.1 ATPase BadF/BadG/BcrA/BcrD type [Beutenbergia cavernae DSM 12333]
MRLLLGVDVGGTSVSALAVMALPGAPATISVGRGPGANINSGGGARDVRASLHTAVAEAVRPLALDDAARQGVSAVVGASGAAAAGRDRIVAVVSDVWTELGLPTDAGSLDVSTDLEIAFAAGSGDDADGVLLLAGTGAVAARVRSGHVVRRRDGMGWLLGDVGSGLWLALEAVRASAAELDARGPRTALTPIVLHALGIDAGPDTGADPRQALVAAAYAGPVAALGRLAPLVSQAADDGDAVAGAIVARAVAALVSDAVAMAAGDQDDVPCVVLAGSVLTSVGPVSRGVRAGLGHRLPRVAVRAATAPVLGALHLAERRADVSLDPLDVERAAATVALP